MALSKAKRIAILLAIDGIFFFIELIAGYAFHSLALVADAFHMLNDVLSLCVGLWAVRVANQRGSSKKYTYGWQRAETLGALVNGVFLVALCVTIFLDAISRFAEPQEVTQPKYMLIVGCLGLGSNILGLVLFHDHSHGHGGGGHSHEHSHDVETGEREHNHAHEEAHTHHEREESEVTAVGSPLKQKVSSASTQSRINRRSSRSHSRSLLGGINEIPTSPHAIRNSIVYRSTAPAPASDAGDTEDEGTNQANDSDAHVENDQSQLLNGRHGIGYGALATGKPVDHTEHNHAQPKSKAAGGHSHDLNMRGIFLHVMGDALGNIGVISTALVIWLTKLPGRQYFDPAVSLFITCIILASAIPLCKAASRILLQAAPDDIDVEEIREDILSMPDVFGVHHLHVWQLSDTKKVASLHVEVDCDLKSEGSAKYMALAQEINNCLHAYGIHSSTIQPEFCLDPNHDHKTDSPPLENGYSSSSGKRSKPPSRMPSKAGSMHEVQCLLGCGNEGCGGQSCCPPPESHAHEGHGHDHAH